jgi:hypothetical protein
MRFTDHPARSESLCRLCWPGETVIPPTCSCSSSRDFYLTGPCICCNSTPIATADIPWCITDWPFVNFAVTRKLQTWHTDPCRCLHTLRSRYSAGHRRCLIHTTGERAVENEYKNSFIPLGTETSIAYCKLQYSQISFKPQRTPEITE